MIDWYIDPADKSKGEVISSIRIHWREPRPMAMPMVHVKAVEYWESMPPIPVEPWEFKSAVFSFTPFDLHNGRRLFDIAVERIERLKALIVYKGMEPKEAFTRMVAEYDIEQTLGRLAQMELLSYEPK